MKIFRLAAYLVLLTLVFNLGDWPFVDEIFAEYSQNTVLETPQKISTQTDADSIRIEKGHDKGGSAGSIYFSLTHLLDSPRYNLILPKRIDFPRHFPEKPIFVSAILPPLERPPAVIDAIRMQAALTLNA